MANLHFISNVMHNGIVFKGRQIKNNQVVFDGMVVDLGADTRGLGAIAASLVDRGLAEYVDAPATHTTNFVNAAQEAIPVNAPAGTGSAPVADQVIARENLQKAKQPENQTPASEKHGLFGFGAKPAETAAAAQPAAPAPTPAAPANQPSAEEVAATAASVA